jgi:ubiquitin-conjugating enzyme E2 N
MRLLSEPDPGIEARAHEDNLRYFQVFIEGPVDSPYEGIFVYINL